MSWLLLITLNQSYALGLVLSYWFWSITFVSTHKERVDACVQYKECQSNYPRKISLTQRFVPSIRNITSIRKHYKTLVSDRTFGSAELFGRTSTVQYKECQSNYPRKISLAQRFVPSTLISLINVTSRLPILENNTLHKTKIPPARLLISLQNFQYSYRT